jgi:hypothetical protein
MDLNKSINVFEPKSKDDCTEVTITTEKSRKTFHIKRPLQSNEQYPMAIESFAIEPHYYAELMRRVESLHSKPE